jgi:spore germination protein PE
MCRTSVVRRLRTDAVEFASTLLVGDLGRFDSETHALAVQREVATFWGNEGDLASFAIFSRPIPLPTVNETVDLVKVNTNPNIVVDEVRVISVSTASLAQVGSVRSIRTEARIKHIRHFVRNPSGLGGGADEGAVDGTGGTEDGQSERGG